MARRKVAGSGPLSRPFLTLWMPRSATPWAWMIATVAGAACLQDVTSQVPPACYSADGDWIFASESGAFGPRVLILNFLTDSTLEVHEVPSLSADGSSGAIFDSGPINSVQTCSLLVVESTLRTSNAPIALDFTITQDTARGTLTLPTGTFSLIGIRVDPAQLTNGVAPQAAPSADSTPVVMLRLDDVWAQDSLFLPRLVARHITAELAVPTTFPGKPGRNSWSNIVAAAQMGFGIAAHSRTHTAATDSGLGFMAEVIGSFQDLRERGLPTSVFVQPGPWTGSLNFDSPQKLENWRGALLRNVSSVCEAYVGGWSVPTGQLGDVPLGVSHTTMTGYDSTSILSQYRRVFAAGAFTILMFHSKDVIPQSQLDWLLDSLASAQAAKRLRLVNSSSLLPVLRASATGSRKLAFRPGPL